MVPRRPTALEMCYIYGMEHRLQCALRNHEAGRRGGSRRELERPQHSQIGSDSLPVERLRSAGLAITPVHEKGSGNVLTQLAEAFRALRIPVIGRVNDDRLLLDLRCLEDTTLLTRQLDALRLASAES